jgi:glutamyl-tRNA reductase
MATWLVHIALLAYAAGAAAFLTWLVRPDFRWVRIGRGLLLAGVIVHFAAFATGFSVAALGLGAGAWKGGQLFSLLAAITVAAYLILDFRYELPVAGAFVAPFTVAVMVPAHLVPSAAHAVAPQLYYSIALFLHVGAAALGTGVLALAFGLALLYLASEKQVKSKRPGRLFARLPSLDLLDRAGYRLAVWGFVFLSLTIATGSLVSREATGTTLPFAPKQGFAILAWALFASLIQARLVAGWRGRRVALLVVTGFVLLAGVYVGLLSAAPVLHGGAAATFLCVGLSHRQAVISVREQLALPDDLIPARVQKLRSLPGVREAFLLSTCNRFEVFAVAEKRESAEDVLEELGPVAAPFAVCRFEEEALRHLFRVAASLDSMVVGEAQILGQVKEAAALAQQAGALGPELQRALARALSAAKRVRTETEIARGAVSVASVAVRLAHKLLGSLEGRSVLLLGAGEMAQLAARELRSEGASELLVANRNPARAEELGKEYGGVPVSLAELPALLERADVAICSTGASHPVVTREMMAKALKARRYRPIFLVDLTLPRNVEPSANELENVYVYDLDDLEHVAAQNRDLRESQVGKAEAIVEEELKAFVKASRERNAVPVLARLREHAETIASAEAEKTLAGLRGLDERQQKSVRAMASAIVNKLLHHPTAKLRAEAGDGPLGDAAATLFALEASPGPSPVPMPVPDPAPDPSPRPLPEPDPEPAVLPFRKK